MDPDSDDKSFAEVTGQEEEDWVKAILIRSVNGSTYGFEIVLNESDGSCLFRAISQALYASQSRHVEIRHDLVNYITHDNNWEKYLPFLQAQHDGLKPSQESLSDPVREKSNNENDSKPKKSLRGRKGVDQNNNAPDINNNTEWTGNNSECDVDSRKIARAKSSASWKKLYVKFMRNGSTFGTLQELQAAAELYEFNLIVIREVADVVYNVQNFDEQKWLTTQVFYFTGHSDNGHFELLQPDERSIQVYNYKYDIPIGNYRRITWNRYTRVIMIKQEIVPEFSESKIQDLVAKSRPPAAIYAAASGEEGAGKIGESSTADDDYSGISVIRPPTNRSNRRAHRKKSSRSLETRPKLVQPSEFLAGHDRAQDVSNNKLAIWLSSQERPDEDEVTLKTSLNRETERAEKVKVITKEPVNPRTFNNLNAQQFVSIPPLAKAATKFPSSTQVNENPLDPKVRRDQSSSHSVLADSDHSSSSEDELSNRSSQPSIINVAASESRPNSYDWVRHSDSGSKQALFEIAGIRSSRSLMAEKYYADRRDGREAFKDLNANQYKPPPITFYVPIRDSQAASASSTSGSQKLRQPQFEKSKEKVHRVVKTRKPVFPPRLRQLGLWLKEVFCCLCCCCIYFKHDDKSDAHSRERETDSKNVNSSDS